MRIAVRLRWRWWLDTPRLVVSSEAPTQRSRPGQTQSCLGWVLFESSIGDLLSKGGGFPRVQANKEFAHASQAVVGRSATDRPGRHPTAPFPADDDHRPYDHRQQRRSNLQIRFRHASGASYELPLGHVSTVTLGHAKTSLKFSSAFTCAERTLVAPDECCGSYPGSRVACGPTSELCTADGSSCE